MDSRNTPIKNLDELPDGHSLASVPLFLLSDDVFPLGYFTHWDVTSNPVQERRYIWTMVKAFRSQSPDTIVPPILLIKKSSGEDMPKPYYVEDGYHRICSANLAGLEYIVSEISE